MDGIGTDPNPFGKKLARRFRMGRADFFVRRKKEKKEKRNPPDTPPVSGPSFFFPPLFSTQFPWH
jgi:hypothetical protein